MGPVSFFSVIFASCQSRVAGQESQPYFPHTVPLSASSKVGIEACEDGEHSKMSYQHVVEPALSYVNAHVV